MLRCVLLPIGLGLMTISMTGCGAAGSDGGVCPPVIDYSLAEQVRVADELRGLPPGAAVREWIKDYGVLRAQARACR